MLNSSVSNSQVTFANNNVHRSGNTTTDSHNVNIQNPTGNVTVNTGLEVEDRETLYGVEHKVRQISDSLEDKKRKAILKWLSKVDYIQHHDFIASARQPNTGDWLFEKDHFQQWIKASSPIFWLHGNPGAGKTVLA
ncbi:hypothetical protein RUND412_010302, partial [Rhizina undulata]